MIPITQRLRILMETLDCLRSEHNRQRSCPSRGYDEDSAISEMNRLEDEIEAELNAIDSSAGAR